MTHASLTPVARLALIGFTRAILEAAVRRLAGPSDEERQNLCAQYSDLTRPGGAFVTIYIQQELRGCLGEIVAEDGVINAIRRCAWRVAREDWRFDPVRPEELPALTFKISLLSHPQPLHDVDDIVLGRDGLIVEYQGRRGLLLPEVPLEYGWDTPTFLAHLWQKAGIAPTVPVAAVRLHTFSSTVLDSTEADTAHPAET